MRLTVLFSYFNNDLFTALQQLDTSAFMRSILIFGVLAAIWVVNSLLAYYVQQRLVIRGRVWLNDHIVGDWLDGGAYHRNRFITAPVDNPDQRIQEDIDNFTGNTATLAIGAVSAIVSLASFTVVLWQLSGPLSVFGVEIPRAMTFFAYLYVIIASVVAFRIGRPLIQLNFLRERFNASFRYALVRLRDNSEDVAFHRGEPIERATLGARFSGDHRQRVGDRLPEPAVPRLQLRHHPGVGGRAVRHPGAPVLRGRDHPGRPDHRPPSPSARSTTPCRSSATPTTTSRSTAPSSSGSTACSTPTRRPARCRRSTSRRARASRCAA